MERILTVKQLNRYICGVFEDELVLHNILVSGEIFELRQSASNTFIVLREEDNVLDCYKYGKIDGLERGQRVIVRGSVKFYPKGGKTFLSISEIRLSGEGEYHAELLRLTERLRAEGLFDTKKGLPPFIERVSIITSLEGAVIHDFLSVISMRHSYIDIKIHDVSVQGDSAAKEIVDKIEALNRAHFKEVGYNLCERAEMYDGGEKTAKNRGEVIVIARGGGSFRDLQPFNSEAVARAVSSSALPIISAVGHETDYSLCDFCSDLRAATPSLAAEIIAKNNQERLDYFLSLLNTAYRLVEGKLSQKSDLANMLARGISYESRITLQRLGAKISSLLRDMYDQIRHKLLRSGDIEQLSVRLHSMVEKCYLGYERQLCTIADRLDANSPLKLLSGGYARVMAAGEGVTSVSQLRKDDEVDVFLGDGSFSARVIDKKHVEKNSEK